MAVVYSTQLALASSLGGFPTTVFTAPPGYRTVITTISAVTGTNSPLVWWALSETASTARFAGASHSSGTTDYTNDLLNGRWVFDAGQVLSFQSDGSLWDLMLSGFLLVLP